MKLAKRSEKGLLTPDNCVVALIDHQPQMLFGITSIDRQTLINNVVGFAKAAKIFDVPLILSTVETKSFSGNIWPQLQAIYPSQTPIERSSMNSWDDESFVAAIKKTGKKKIVLAGLWTEVCVAFPTVQAGAKPVTWIQVMLEWQRDWAQTGTYAAVMDVVKNHGGAYGMGVEYAYTMVHGAAPTVHPGWEVPSEKTHS
jgi:nicotinamidase-related amidase